MHIVGLRLTNWMRFRGEHTLDLGPTVYAIVAADSVDPNRSNWLCKSGLLSALRWALDGRRPERFTSIDQAISHGETAMAVDVELDDGTFVSRTKLRGKAEQLVAAFPSPSELHLAQVEAEAELWRRIALTPDDVLTTCFAEQGKIDHLARLKSSALTEIIGGWLDLDRLVRAQELVGEWFEATSKKRDALARRALELREAIAASPLEQLQAVLEEAECKFAQAKADAERFEQQNQRYLSHRLARERVERARREMAEARRLEELAAKIEVPEQISELDERYRGALLARDLADKEVRRLKALSRGEFDGECPASKGFVCPARDEINRRNKSNQRAVEEQLAVAEKMECECAEAHRAHQSAHELVRRKRELLSAAELHRKAATVSAADQRLAEDDVIPPNPVAAPDERSVREALAAIETRRQNVAILEAIERELVTEEASVAAARLAYAALGPEGAQRRISERSVARIEARANEELARIADLSVRARWGRETQELATQCPECGRAFPATRKSRVCEGCGAPRGPKVKPELKFELSDVSGAALVLAGLALRIGAFQWLRERRNSPWGVGVFDEPFGALDRAHSRALTAHMLAMLKGTFEQTFLIAHTPGVLDSLPSRIVITGRGEWSEAKVVG